MARLLGDFIGRVRPDVIVPVPLYRGKLRKRGYNQAACLARALGRSLELPVDEKLVKRVRNTAPMKHLNPTERQNNLKKAFIIGRNDVNYMTGLFWWMIFIQQVRPWMRSQHC